MATVGLLGIDIGTSGCRAVLINPQGNILAEAATAYSPTYPKEGWAEQDPDDWYQAAASAVRTLLSHIKIVDVNIVGIGVTGQMISSVFVGADGHPVYPAILWMDQRTITEVERLKEYEDEISTVTKTPINTAYTLPRILWLRDNLPDVWKNARKLLLAKDYVRFRLTGEYATDPSDGSGTLLLDSERRGWSSRILEITELPPGLLPPVLPSHEVAGELTGRAAADLGLPVGIPVVTGAGDLFAENLAAGNFIASQRLIRFGSCGSVSSPLNRPVLDPNRRCPCYAHCVPGYWLVETSTQAFGLAESWFKSEFLTEASQSVHEYMEQLAGAVPPGADGLVFHPFIKGAPYWNPDLKGGFIGVTPVHTKGHFARAVLEGTAYSLLDAIRLLDKATGDEDKFFEWSAIGGGTASRVWTEIVASMIGNDLTVLNGASPSLGAAKLAGIGTRIISDYRSPLEAVSAKSVEYDESIHTFYQKEYKRYRIVHARLSL